MLAAPRVRARAASQYGDILVELRQVDLGDPVVMDGHMLGALGPERGEGVHGRAGDRPVGEKLDSDEACRAKCAGDKSLRRAVNLIGIEGGNRRRCGKHHKRGCEEKRALGQSGLRVGRPDSAQACISRDRDESDQSGVWLEQVAPGKPAAERRDHQNHGDDRQQERREPRRRGGKERGDEEQDGNEGAAVEAPSVTTGST
jgi:hypothetical protein